MGCDRTEPYPRLGSFELVVSFLHLVKVPLYLIRLPSDQTIGGIGNVAEEITDLNEHIVLVSGGDFRWSDLYGFLSRSDWFMGEKFTDEV